MRGSSKVLSGARRWSLIAAGIVTLATLGPGCGSDDGDGDGDGGNLEPPAECALTAPPDDFVYPTGPFGTEVGDLFEDIELDDCDGNKIRFGDILAQSKVTLFNIGAGWCQPCVDETETLDAEIFRASCGQGLRVVQVLFQDQDAEPATKLFCSEWREQFTLSFPVLVDPLFATQKYFQSVESQTPINYLIDPTGTIRYKETGTPAGDLPQRIQSLLAE